MLEIRPSCENCNKKLPYDSKEAMVCTFECTFCKDCVEAILHNVCPNCGGGFTKRPVRPSGYLQKYPVSTRVVHKPVNLKVFENLLKKFKNISPSKR